MKQTQQNQDFVISQVAGEDTLKLVEYLTGKENTSEFIIAEEMGIEIQQIRNMLYRLLHKDLVTFNRKKDKQKGWYIYYWTYKPANVPHLYWDIKQKRLESLKERLGRESNIVFFHCPTGCIRLEFDKAVAFDFRCPECGEMLLQQDNSQLVKQLRVEIDDLQSELEQKPSIIRVNSIPVAPKKPAVAKKVPAVKKVTAKKAPTTKKVAAKKTVTRKAKPVLEEYL